jgi:hypothetical protein
MRMVLFEEVVVLERCWQWREISVIRKDDWRRNYSLRGRR